MSKPVLFSFFWFFLFLLWGEGVRGQMVNETEAVRVSLVSDRMGVTPGEPVTVGALFQLAPGWHIYWKNPGDVGMPIRLEWELPEGGTMGELQWPVPRRLVEPGDFHVFGYKGAVLLFAKVLVPQGFRGQEATFRMKADWLACENTCIPGDASVELTLPVLSGAENLLRNTELFAQAEARVPKAGKPPFSEEWSWNGGGWDLSLAGVPPGFSFADFIPGEESQAAMSGHGEVAALKDGEGKVKISAQGPVQGVLVFKGEKLGEKTEEGWQVRSPQGLAEKGAEGIVPVPAAQEDAGVAKGEKGQPMGLWMALIYGMLGGLILNLMPCVLPVISLKIFGFLRQAGESKGKILRHGLAFAGGIFLWFFGLAVAVVLLRQGGEQVTWAFQFQNSWFLLFLSVVVFVFSLNLFGVFEIVLPGKAGATMSGLAEKDGYAGSFFQGIFATLLATPCTAPFLGTALGFAFGQSGAVIFAMFASVAFGMAFPYVILAARPGWIRFLPKPGAWMERLKQFMGFPLLATLVWLLSVLGGQKGLAGVVWVLSLLLCFGFACWLYGAFFCFPATGRARLVAGVVALVACGGGGWYFGGLFSGAEKASGEGVSQSGGIAWVPFRAETLAGLLAQGKPVFVDFTADWCLTCKFNERTAIDTPAVRGWIASKGIVPMKADWTASDPAITAELKKFGRVGVPFYVFYPQGDKQPPVVLPELLTESVLLKGLGQK